MFRTAFDYVGGKYYSSNSRSSDIYNDHMLTWNDRFADKIDINAAVGTSFTRHYDRNSNITTAIDTCGVPNAFVPQNSKHSRPNNPNGSATSAYDSWNNNDWTYTALESHYETLVRYMGWTNVGRVVATDSGTRGMCESTDFPQMAYELGKKVGTR